MKVVQIEDYFHPDAGYQINILSKYMVRAGHDVTIITSEMDKVPDKLVAFFGKENIRERDNEYTRLFGVKIIRLPLKAFISGRAVFKKEIFQVIQDEKPDLVFVHGNDTLTGMRYLIKANRLGYPLVMDSHMLEMASTNRLNKLYRIIYKLVFTPIIVKNQIPIIRTQDDPYVEKCLGIPLKQCPWISVGSDTMLFHPDEHTRARFREANNISQDAFIVLYAGKLDESKGGMLLAETIKEKFDEKREVIFLVVGKTSGEYGKKVEEEFAASENRIIRFPTQKYRDLAQFYQAADLAVFPRQCSLSFYDVQACGVPVVFENNNINVERSKHGNGLMFQANDVGNFREKISEMTRMPEDQYKRMQENSIEFVRSEFDYADIAQKYMTVMENVVQKSRS